MNQLKVGIRGLVPRLGAVALLVIMSAATALAQEKKPNILVIWGDDIGQFNISAE
jgi:hypothetical protein